jgi:protein transport protein SEC61 subunit alpha
MTLLGKWGDYTMVGHANPIGGLAYYISPPVSFIDIIRDPLHVVIYIAFMMASCGFFARVWIDISGTSSRDLARQLTEKEMVIKGMREESMMRYLNGYIPIAAAFGGVTLALLAVFADFMGALGSGSSIVLALTIIYQQFENFAKERERGAEAFMI